MSFVGFDATLLTRDCDHPTNGLGFGAVPDPFATTSDNRGHNIAAWVKLALLSLILGLHVSD